MQKKLLTLAVAGAMAAPCIAFAQASVEVYGTVYPTFGRVKYGDGFTARDIDARTGLPNAAAVGVPGAGKFDFQAPASNFGVRGRESLGGGLTAWFQIEQNAPLEREASQAVTVASRNSAAGVQGSFGNIFGGQWTTPWADMDSLWAIGQVGPFGPVTSLIGRRETTGTSPNPGGCASTAIPPGGFTTSSGALQCDAVAGAGGVGHPFWRRASDMIRWTSPTWGGTTIDLMYQVPENKSVSFSGTGTASSTQTGGGYSATPSMYSMSAKWSGMGGAARIGLALDRHKDFTTVGKTDTGWAVKGGWNFGMADLGFAYEHMIYKCGDQPFTGTASSVQLMGTTVLPGGGTAIRPALCGPNDGDVTSKVWAIAASVPVGPGSIKFSYAKANDMTGAIAFGQTGAKQWLAGYEHRFSKRTSIGVEYAKITNNRNAQLTWTGMPPNQLDNSNTAFFGSSVGWGFVNMTHRF